MICSRCGHGNVLWMGPLACLTHTECANCGGTNCQELDPEPEEEPEPDTGGAMGFHTTNVRTKP